MKRLTILATGVAVALSVTAFGQRPAWGDKDRPAPPPRCGERMSPEDRFAADDVNGDGVLDDVEFRGPARAFDRIDADGDRYLTPEELQAAGPPPRGPRPPCDGMIEHLDADGDGAISEDEFPGPAEHFDRIDTDSDGYLTLEELQAAGPPPQRGRRGGPRDATEGPPSHEGRPPRGALIERLDADSDSAVSADEFDGPAELFERLDRDGDGYITEDEVPQGPPPGRRGGPQRGGAGAGRRGPGSAW